MNSNVIQVPIFDWTITVMYNINKNDIKECENNLIKFGAPNDIVGQLTDNIRSDGASTLQGPGNQLYVAFPIFYSLSSMFKLIPHEISHIVSNICESQGIKDSETFSYLTGFISSSFYELGIIGNMISANDNTKNEFATLVPVNTKVDNND